MSLSIPSKWVMSILFLHNNLISSLFYKNLKILSTYLGISTQYPQIDTINELLPRNTLSRQKNPIYRLSVGVFSVWERCIAKFTKLKSNLLIIFLSVLNNYRDHPLTTLILAIITINIRKYKRYVVAPYHSSSHHVVARRCHPMFIAYAHTYAAAISNKIELHHIIITSHPST